MTSLTAVSADSGTEEFLINPVHAILESGTTLTYLPHTVTGPLFDKLNAYARSAATIPIVYIDCALQDAGPSLLLSYIASPALTGPLSTCPSPISFTTT